VALFGTDGIRGLANVDLTAELALDVAVAAAHILVETRGDSNNRPRAIVGQDSRASGDFLEAAVVAGLTSAGVDVYRVGVLPTPAIAFLVAHTGADLGVMISASHNPAPDNGIKLFARGGEKLADSLEVAIEARMSELWQRPTGANVGRVVEDKSARDIYINHLLKSIETPLKGIKVVVDCANGAASFVAPTTLEQAGATVIAIANTPNGLNINDGVGSTHLDFLREAVLKNKADIGIAHDGDADRCLAIDSDGNVIDGDFILAILANGFKARRILKDSTVVATVMSNLGFILAMKELGISVAKTAVGDRYVLEKMLENNFTLGGEQSGHIIMREFAGTGDGLLTALQLISEMARTNKSLKELSKIMNRFPQVLINVSGIAKEKLDTSSVIAAAVTKHEAELGDTGRILLRASGTEPLVRIMVEAQSDSIAKDIAEKLAKVVKEELR
jgi:phosphoglucosamine mutase